MKHDSAPSSRHTPRRWQPQSGASAHSVAGVARLEFALTVIVVGVIVTLALNRVMELQSLAKNAQAAVVAAQKRTYRALAEARRALIPKAASKPQPAAPARPSPPITPAQEPPPKGAP